MQRTISLLLALLLVGACSSDSGETDASISDGGPHDGQPGSEATADRGPGEGAPDGPPAKGTFSEVKSFGSNPGNLRMYIYVPAGMPAAPAPLVVVLHGCNITATAYATASGWNELADEYKLYVVYPEQQAANNNYTCFNWFNPPDYLRDQGESASILQMVQQTKKDHAIDDNKVFVTGLSAGGAMAVNLGATYPDVFAGVGAMAAIPYGCANDANSGFACMDPGVDQTPTQWGAKAKGAHSGYTGPYPVMTVFHGSADGTISDMNLTEIVDQWTSLHGTDTVPEIDEDFHFHPHKVYKDASGRAVVESYHLQQMPHGITVDPGLSPEQGGQVTWFAFDLNIWSSYYAAKFWGLL
jgi:poly(hydroxyalkanoate) depolymerase family esterase